MWGAGLLGESLVRVPLVYLVPVDLMVGLSTVMMVCTMAALAGWNILYVLRAAGGTRAEHPATGHRAVMNRTRTPMEFFCFHRDRRGAMPLRDELREEHWSYMDRFDQQMVARGPTLDVHGQSPTGSVHIVRAADGMAARAFALDEPYYQAGVFQNVLIRRWTNRLGRTMWDFPPGYSDEKRFLVIGFGSGPGADLEPRSTRTT